MAQDPVIVPALGGLQVLSFGYGHTGGRGPLEATMTLDLRRLLRDPHVDPQLRALTGADARVRARVLGTEGAGEVLDATTGLVFALLRAADAAGGGVTVAVGCVGGRHRSYVAAELLAERAIAAGYRVRLTHLHAHLPVIGH